MNKEEVRARVLEIGIIPVVRASSSQEAQFAAEALAAARAEALAAARAAAIAAARADVVARVHSAEPPQSAGGTPVPFASARPAVRCSRGVTRSALRRTPARAAADRRRA